MVFSGVAIACLPLGLTFVFISLPKPIITRSQCIKVCFDSWAHLCFEQLKGKRMQQGSSKIPNDVTIFRKWPLLRFFCMYYRLLQSMMSFQCSTMRNTITQGWLRNYHIWWTVIDLLTHI